MTIEMDNSEYNRKHLERQMKTQFWIENFNI